MNNVDTAQLGIRLVKGELERRGLAVSESYEGRRQVLSADGPGGRRLIKVSTRTGGTWQTSIEYGERPARPEYGNRLWIFVDLSTAAPSFYVVPYRWMSEDIHDGHQQYLRAHGGRRARNQMSTHHAVQLKRIAQWANRWDLASG
jgi:hypothetical protein